MAIKNSLNSTLNKLLSPKQIERIALSYRSIERLYLQVNFFFTNKFRIKKARQSEGLKLHVGCGNKRIEGYKNVDMVAGRHVDILADLNIFQFPENCCDTIFSHAFFEHITAAYRVAHLEGAMRSLKKTGGNICYIGMPYFKYIAELYLQKSEGPNGSLFDAEQVYKFTHGGTTIDILNQGVAFTRKRPTYLYAELHKALYDEDELHKLLQESGYSSYAIFTTVYPKDKNPIPVNIGFYASNLDLDLASLRDECSSYLKQFDGQYIDHQKLSFLD